MVNTCHQGCAAERRLIWFAPGDAAARRIKCHGWVMRHIVLIAAMGAALGGCTSFSMDSFRSAPPSVTIQIESVPPGADAVTSAGPGCKTPCSVAVPAIDNLSVSFTLPRYQPATVPVQIVQIPGDYTTPPSISIDPNPVFAELLPATPPKRARRAAASKRRAPAPVAATPAPSSPFPPPR